MSRRKHSHAMTLGEIVRIYGLDSDEAAEYTVRPTAEMLADRDRRYYETPRTLTSILMGDPPPGYSALDRKGANDVAANLYSRPDGTSHGRCERG